MKPFDPVSDNKKIIPYDIKAEKKRQDYARAQQQGEPTGIPTSILKDQEEPIKEDNNNE